MAGCIVEWLQCHAIPAARICNEGLKHTICQMFGQRPIELYCVKKVQNANSAQIFDIFFHLFEITVIKFVYICR